LKVASESAPGLNAGLDVQQGENPALESWGLVERFDKRPARRFLASGRLLFSAPIAKAKTLLWRAVPPERGEEKTRFGEPGYPEGEKTLLRRAVPPERGDLIKGPLGAILRRAGLFLWAG